MLWGAVARVGPLRFTCLWAILSSLVLISLRGTQSLRNSNTEVPDALNSDSVNTRRVRVAWPRLDRRSPRWYRHLARCGREPVLLGFN